MIGEIFVIKEVTLKIQSYWRSGSFPDKVNGVPPNDPRWMYGPHFVFGKAGEVFHNYKNNRENGEIQDNPGIFPDGGFFELELDSALGPNCIRPGAYPDNEWKHWWVLTCRDGRVVKDFYWTPDNNRGCPDKLGRHWYIIHGPNGLRMEQFSLEPDDRKDKDGTSWYYFQYTENGAIKNWMEKKDYNYLKRICIEKFSLFESEFAKLKTANPWHPAISKLESQCTVPVPIPVPTPAPVIPTPAPVIPMPAPVPTSLKDLLKYIQHLSNIFINVADAIKDLWKSIKYLSNTLFNIPIDIANALIDIVSLPLGLLGLSPTFKNFREYIQYLSGLLAFKMVILEIIIPTIPYVGRPIRFVFNWIEWPLKIVFFIPHYCVEWPIRFIFTRINFPLYFQTPAIIPALLLLDNILNMLNSLPIIGPKLIDILNSEDIYKQKKIQYEQIKTQIAQLFDSNPLANSIKTYFSKFRDDRAPTTENMDIENLNSKQIQISSAARLSPLSIFESSIDFLSWPLRYAAMAKPPTHVESYVHHLVPINETYAHFMQTDSLFSTKMLQNIPLMAVRENHAALVPYTIDTVKNRVFELTREINPDVRTGVPVFTFHAFEQTNLVGMISLYGHPLICRSEDSLRHNVIDREGIFETPIIKTEKLSDICEILPPDETALRYQFMERSASHGALRGSTNVIEQAMRQQGISQEASRYTSNTIYFIGYWLLSFMQHYQDYSSISDATSEDNAQVVFRAAMNACYDVLYLFVVSAACAGLSSSAQYAAQRAQSAGWTKTAQAVSFFGQHTSKLIYAQGIRENGFINTALNVGSGTVAQQAIECLGNQVFAP